jgi:hypothetical protein
MCEHYQESSKAKSEGISSDVEELSKHSSFNGMPAKGNQ